MAKITEEWSVVRGVEGYSVSNWGRVRRDKHGQGTWAGRILKPVIDDGYPQVNLWFQGRHHRFRVHAIVASHFIGDRPEGAHVNHIDGDKQNNSVWNLEYVSATENTLHQHRIGLTRVRGSDNGHAKLDDDAVRTIRRLKGVRKGVELAARYGVSPATISEVQSRKVWAHVE